MEWNVEGIGESAQTLILPLFEEVAKAPNKATSGLGRSTSAQVREAVVSDDFDGKSGKSLTLWNSGQKVVLAGMGLPENLAEKDARDAGAKLLASLSKQHGKSLTVRFTTGWRPGQMIAFAENSAPNQDSDA